MTGAPPSQQARSAGVADRLLETSWEARVTSASRRELLSETVAAVLFVVAATGLLWLPNAAAGFEWVTAGVLVAMYALVALVDFPFGAGRVLPTQLVLFPMLVLLPPATVPGIAATGSVAAAAIALARGRARPKRLLSSVPDAWHTVGAASVLLLAGSPELTLEHLPLLGAAFAAGCVVDLASATLREAGALGIAPGVQLRVILLVWAVDACLAPIGLLGALVAGESLAAVGLILPLAVLLLLLARDRNVHVRSAQRRLAQVDHERRRLQSAVRRLGDAFAAKLDLDGVLGIALQGSLEALDAEGGRLALPDPDAPRDLHVGLSGDLAPALAAAEAAALEAHGPRQTRRGGVWALAVPFGIAGAVAGAPGSLALARSSRAFADDEIALLAGLVDKARTAAGEILRHRALQVEANSDALTGLGNRRKLFADLADDLASARPTLLMLFDLDGFKAYNDAFGHPAGDALLVRLGARLAAAVAPEGRAYRLGGDEFCAVVPVRSGSLGDTLATVLAALSDDRNGFAVEASFGAVLLPHEAGRPDRAVKLADERMYRGKRERVAGAHDQARDVLLRTLETRRPQLEAHATGVAALAVEVADRLGLDGEALDAVARVGELHDVGKLAIPDAILDKPAPLSAAEWTRMYEHTLLGEHIVRAAPALRPVAPLVRSTHERWDGGGYPDGLCGEAIPLPARIVAVCDAYEAMTADRPYRRARPRAAARAELRRAAGSQFDPRVVDAFLALDGDAGRPAAREAAGCPVAAAADRLEGLLSTGGARRFSPAAAGGSPAA